MSITTSVKINEESAPILGDQLKIVRQDHMDAKASLSMSRAVWGVINYNQQLRKRDHTNISWIISLTDSGVGSSKNNPICISQNKLGIVASIFD